MNGLVVSAWGFSKNLYERTDNTLAVRSCSLLVQGGLMNGLVVSAWDF